MWAAAVTELQVLSLTWNCSFVVVVVVVVVAVAVAVAAGAGAGAGIALLLGSTFSEFQSKAGGRVGGTGEVVVVVVVALRLTSWNFFSCDGNINI